MKKERDAALRALGMMYAQYCGREGHLFMQAGEAASELLENYGLLQADDSGCGEIDYEKLDKLTHPYDLGNVHLLDWSAFNSCSS